MKGGGMSQHSVIGQRLPYVDGKIKSTGEAKFSADIGLAKMLIGKILRSPYPHARILNIDTSRAERLIGVKGIVTGKDTAGVKIGFAPVIPFTEDKCQLVVDKVRFIGDEVACVAATDEDIAEEALDLIQVEYEQLPAVFDPEEAMDPKAPRIHDHAERNISVECHLHYGDVEKGFRQSDYVREDRFITQYVNHSFLEPHASVADFDSSGKLTIWASTQTPYYLRRDLARTLQMSEVMIRVIKPCVGGGFGGKAEMFPLSFCAAILSKKTGRPVKIVYTREEVFSSGSRRHPTKFTMKIGVKRDGTLMAKQCSLISDGGSYCSIGSITIYLHGVAQTLPYRLPNFKYDGYRVYTNKPFCGAQRGHGFVQPQFATEVQLNIIAEELGLDPVELRLKNYLRAGEVAPNGVRVISTGLVEGIERAMKDSSYREKWRKRKDHKGIGMACSGFVSGAGFDFHMTPTPFTTASIRMLRDGTFGLFTGTSDIGQGSNTVLSQIAAEELGVSMEDIRITAGDTETAPYDMGSYSSRVTLFAGNAVKAAASEAKKKIFQIAAQKLEANVEDLEAGGGRVYIKGSPDRGMSFSEIMNASERTPIVGHGHFNPETGPVDMQKGIGNLSPTYSFDCYVAQLEVDGETGKIKVTRIDAAHDCGFAVNPMNVEGQLQGSIQMGLGQALSEDIIMDKGQILNPSFLDYKFPLSVDMPEINPIIIESMDPVGPFGAKEASEGIILPVPPAIANAIHDAVGLRVFELPITPEKILESLER